MNFRDLYLAGLPTGELSIGEMTPFGYLPIIRFPDIDSFRRFGEGIISFCNERQVTVPDVFLHAFDEEDIDGRDRDSQDK